MHQSRPRYVPSRAHQSCPSNRAHIVRIGRKRPSATCISPTEVQCESQRRSEFEVASSSSAKLRRDLEIDVIFNDTGTALEPAPDLGPSSKKEHVTKRPRSGLQKWFLKHPNLSVASPIDL